MRRCFHIINQLVRFYSNPSREASYHSRRHSSKEKTATTEKRQSRQRRRQETSKDKDSKRRRLPGLPKPQGRRRNFRAGLPQPARDRRHQEHLVAVLERIRSAPQEANIFLIHINIQESPRLPRFIPQMGLQVGELLVELREQFVEICRRAHDSWSSGCESS